MNEWKTLTKHISCKCKCKVDVRKSQSNQKWNNDKCWCERKKHYICEKDYIWNPATCSCENGKYLTSINDNSVITCDEIIDSEVESYNKGEKISVTTSFNEKHAICKTKKVYILLALLLITISSLIAVSIYCYLIKYKSKQKHFLPY